ncbi:hypothetical protein FRC03_001353 [Tulasnella sp. 419]|nr:hypothetical protein FRC03_001353 [Tulasnella sp. 419]
MWDVLCNIETGKITVHKDIRAVAPSPASFPPPPTLNPRSGVVVNAVGDDEMGRLGKEKDGGPGNGAGSTSSGIVSRPDSYDVQFVEEIRELCAQQLTSSVSQNFGETMVRWKFSEYVLRFLRLASRYEETLAPPMTEPTTLIGFPSHPFSETGVSGIVTGTGVAQGFGGSLGTGLCLTDENVGPKEMSANASRIEGWRGTPCYEYWREVGVLFRLLFPPLLLTLDFFCE